MPVYYGISGVDRSLRAASGCCRSTKFDAVEQASASPVKQGTGHRVGSCKATWHKDEHEVEPAASKK